MRSHLSPENRHKIIKFGISKKYIELTSDEKQDDQIVVNKFITTLLYEANRYTWDGENCVQLRSCIEQFAPTFKKYSRIDYEQYILQQETETGTFYGSYLSDDSDSEDERSFIKKKKKEKEYLLSSASMYQERAQINAITLKKATTIKNKETKKIKKYKSGDLKVYKKNASEIFDLNARMVVHHGDEVNQNKVARDLNHLNRLIGKRYSVEEAIAELTLNAQNAGETFTSFYIAQYRGVTHLTTKWNKPSRMAHRRDRSEIGKRQYCSSIYQAAGVSLFRHYDDARQLERDNPTLFDDPAEELREILLTFREPKPYSYHGYSYSSLAYLLQNIYTQDYYGFHELITQDETLKSLLLNDQNPFFSMGDTPYHANKYAYGLKPYPGHEGDRLRPRWKKDGRAERPYSGVVYTSLHPITDFTSNGSLHLITLNREAEIKCKAELMVLAERESCYSSYLDENRIISKHIAKYPSFKSDYKQIFGYKYGLTPALYKKFKDAFAVANPHTQANRELKKLLGEWICSYHEVKLIDEARKEAEERGGVLIYRDINNKFSLQPPIDSVNRNTTKITQEIKTPVKKKQQLRQSFANSKKIIQPILTEEGVEKIIDSITSSPVELESEQASVTNEGNQEMSLPLSLMLNAIQQHRYRALKKFVTLPEFLDAINETFNSDGLLNATLLHLAAARNDVKAIRILTSVPHCQLDVRADEGTDNAKEDGDYYEDIAPLQLAIIRHANEAAIYLLNHERADHHIVCANVPNKDLLRGDMLIELDENDDEDFLGIAWSCDEGVSIHRYRDISLLNLAKERKNEVLMAAINEKVEVLNHVAPSLM